MLGVVDVHCVEGCGGGSAWLPILGIAIAASSFIYAVLAGQRTLRMATHQYKVFAEQLAAHSDFEVSLEYIYPPPEKWAMRAESGRVTVRLRVRVVNTGNRSAEPMRMNLLFPASADNPSWSDERGSEDEHPASPITADEPLRDRAGDEVPARQVNRERPQLGTGTVLLGFFQFRIDLAEGWSEIDLPASVRVWSDHMPEGVVNRQADARAVFRHDPSVNP